MCFFSVEICYVLQFAIYLVFLCSVFMVETFCLQVASFFYVLCVGVFLFCFVLCLQFVFFHALCFVFMANGCCGLQFGHISSFSLCGLFLLSFAICSFIFHALFLW